jgi:hypothetical protein
MDRCRFLSVRQEDPLATSMGVIQPSMTRRSFTQVPGRCIAQRVAWVLTSGIAGCR